MASRTLSLVSPTAVDTLGGTQTDTTGAYVRIISPERDEHGRPKYRLYKIADVDESGQFGSYSIEYQGRQIRESRALLVKYGSASRLFRMADVSNGVIEEVSVEPC